VSATVADVLVSDTPFSGQCRTPCLVSATVSDTPFSGQCRTPCLVSATVSDISQALTRNGSQGVRQPGAVGHPGGHVSARFINVSVPLSGPALICGLTSLPAKL
jgi:hypothetical protein